MEKYWLTIFFFLLLVQSGKKWEKVVEIVLPLLTFVFTVNSTKEKSENVQQSIR